jgi:hypothetical protein
MDAEKLLQKARRIVNILLEVVDDSQDLNDLGFLMSASRIILADELTKSYTEDAEEGDIDVDDKKYLEIQMQLASSLVELELVFLQASYKAQKIDFLKRLTKNWNKIRRNSNKILKYKNIQWVKFENNFSAEEEKQSGSRDNSKEVRYIG